MSKEPPRPSAKGTAPALVAVPPVPPIAVPVTAPATEPATGGAPLGLSPAPITQLRPRHIAVLVSFAALVLLPLIVWAWYLWVRAADQYASDLGFTVRQDEARLAADAFFGLTPLSNAASSDTDILFEYIQSQDIVQQIDTQLDLRRAFSAPYARDPIFAFPPGGSLEDLVAHWRRKVQVSYNPGSGLLDLRIFAFDAATAQQIAAAVLAQSSQLINDLSAIAREDAIRYARADLDQAQDRLRAARAAVTAFRSENRIIDPSADLQSQMGLLTTLQGQLASAVIELDLLRDTTSDADPRIARALRRIEVIEARIEEERSKFSQGSVAGQTGRDYATLMAAFERLTVDREFAEQAYIAALSAVTTARAEAERQSRYLAPYVRPTLAETSQHPRRLILWSGGALFLTLAWSILVLIAYALRDRK